MAITTLGQAIQSTAPVEGDFDALNPRGDNTRIFNMSKAHPAHNTRPAQTVPRAGKSKCDKANLQLNKKFFRHFI